MTSLSGNFDADSMILSRLDYLSLIDTCRTSVYINSICNDQVFWERKIIQEFPNVPLQLDRHSQYASLYFERLSPNRAALEGNLTALKGIKQYTGRLPNSNGADFAAAKGHYDVVVWLIQNRVLPTSKGADISLDGRNWNMLRLLKGYQILPDSNKLTGSAARLDPTTLEILSTIYPLSQGMAQAATGTENIPALDWFAERGFLPYNMSGAVGASSIASLDWLYDHGFRPGFQEIKTAVESGRIPVLDWLWTHGAPFGVTINSDWIPNREIENWLLNHQVKIKWIFGTPSGYW